MFVILHCKQSYVQYCSFETCGEFTGNIHMNSPQDNSPWGIPFGESDSSPQANWGIHEECPGNQIHDEFPMVNSPWWIPHGEFTTVNSPWWIHRGEFSMGILGGIPHGEFPIGNSPWWIPHWELFLGNRIHSREFIWFILENLGMQQQNAAIYVGLWLCNLKQTQSQRVTVTQACAGCQGLLSYCDCHFSLASSCVVVIMRFSDI